MTAFDMLAFLDTKRWGHPHRPGTIAHFIEAMMADRLADYQISAWLMAVCCHGLTLNETIELTQAMVDSGQRIAFDEALRPVVDKHSTGGVGDKTTLVLMPLIAACGYHVAKLSGRGLGFTGGTADKLEAIPGFKVDRSLKDFKDQIHRIGVALASQTADLAPADARLYALRDVTSTVSSIPLITASIVSKKIAAGADVIVLDIKCGQGAFMQTLQEAQALAQSCQAVGAALGRSISTIITQMNQPLGYAIGHTNEVIESIETLKNQGPPDLTELCLRLAQESLCLANPKLTPSEAFQKAQSVLASGQALEVFHNLIAAQGGDPSVIDHEELLPQPAQIIPVLSREGGFITNCQAKPLALAAKALGAGRQHKGDPIDMSVGVVLHKKIGDGVEPGQALASLWVNDKGLSEAQALVEQAYGIAPNKSAIPPLILNTVS